MSSIESTADHGGGQLKYKTPFIPLPISGWRNSWYVEHFLPFAIHRMEWEEGDQRSSGLIVLNRGYKPLGRPFGRYYVYKDDPTAILRDDIPTKQEFEDAGLIGGRWLYRYRDNPTESDHNARIYLERLRVLERLLRPYGWDCPPLQCPVSRIPAESFWNGGAPACALIRATIDAD